MIGNDILKCCMWNVRGLGDKMSDPSFVDHINGYDIIGLFETKLTEPENIQLPNYTIIHSPIRKQIAGGGISILIKKPLQNKVKVIKNTHSEYTWVKVDGHSLHLEHDIYICFAYIAPENSAYTKHINHDILSLIDDDILLFNCVGQVILCGDLNGRIGSEPDYIKNDSSRYVPLYDNYISDIPTTRQNEDQVCNSRGKQILDLCIKTNMRILNGRKFGDTKGKFTCHKYNGSSTIDLVIASEELSLKIQYLRVHDFVINISDHCKISFGINVATPLHVIKNKFQTNNQSMNLHNFKNQWSPEIC